MSLHDDLVATMARLHGLTRWPTRAYDLVIGGARGPAITADAWDDAVWCWYRDDAAVVHLEAWVATTDPGRAALAEPRRVDGTAILIPGHYRLSHELGVHHGGSGDRPALVARGPLPVWRDADRDDGLGPVERWRLGERVPEFSAAGINIHDGGGAPRVGRRSAGCQVIRSVADKDALLDLVRRQQGRGMGARVSYTLIDHSQAPALVEALIALARAT